MNDHAALNSDFNTRFDRAYCRAQRVERRLHSIESLAGIGKEIISFVTYCLFLYLALMSVSDMQNGDLFTFTHNTTYRLAIVISLSIIFLIGKLFCSSPYLEGEKSITIADVLKAKQSYETIKYNFLNSESYHGKQLEVKKLMRAMDAFERIIPVHLQYV